MIKRNVRDGPALINGGPDAPGFFIFALVRPIQNRASKRFVYQSEVRVMKQATLKQATVWSVFFSLRGSLPRDQWRLAMIAAGAVFLFVVSLLLGNSEPDYAASEPAGPSWLVVAWCLAVLCVVTLLCAKRLLDCQRPVWLALTVTGAGLLTISTLATATHHAWPTLAVMSAYFALFALPALIACALHDAED